MSTVRIGPWDVIDPSKRDEELMREAKARSTFPWARHLDYRLSVRFWERSKMPLMPGSKLHSKGYAYGRTILIARGSGEEESIYIVLHETAHHLRLSAKQKLGIMELFRPRLHDLPDDASTPGNRTRIHARFHGTEYWWRSVECHCDQHVTRFTKPRVPSPYAYRRRIEDGKDAQTYREIVLTEQKVPVPTPEEEPEPPIEEGTPEPPEEEGEGESPSAEELQARIDQAVAVLQGAELGVLDTTDEAEPTV